jgi:hypothetical protein
MIELQDDLLAIRLAAIANPLDDSDWLDVVRRAQPPRTQRRRLVVLGLAAVFALVATALAFGWPQSLIDFFRAASAPKPVKNSFGAMNVIAPPGMSPRTIPGQARRIMTAVFNGHRHVLYVAPTRDGGFCFQWTTAMGSCAPPKHPRPLPGAPAGVPAGSLATLGAGMQETRGGPPGIVIGYLIAGKAKTVEAQFAGGGSVLLPITWVSAPINAGFFVYEVPAAHRTRATAVRAIVARDSSGKVVARESFPLESPLDRDTARRLPDGTLVSLPRRAEVAKARKLISFRASNGSMVWLWVMPAQGGGRCYVFNQGSGCLLPRFQKKAMAMADGLSIGTRRVLFWAQLKPVVAEVELRYQDGTVEHVKPVDGFILHEVGPSHYAPGHRLKTAVGLDAQAAVVASHPFTPNAHGTYPCEKPVARGYGVKSCP